MIQVRVTTQQHFGQDGTWKAITGGHIGGMASIIALPSLSATVILLLFYLIFEICQAANSEFFGHDSSILEG